MRASTNFSMVITKYVAKAKVVLAEQAINSPLERPNEIVTNVLSTIEDGISLLKII